MDEAAPLELVIANAGVSEQSVGLAKELEASTRRLTDINVVGVYNTVFPAIDLMKTRQAGQIVIMSSLAGFGGMPASTAYFTTKTAMKAFGYGLRGQLNKYNIGVTTICPGFVRSEMTRINKFPMPGLMDEAPAIAYMMEGIAANVSVVTFPWPMYLAVWYMQNMLPDDARDILFMPFLALRNRRSSSTNKSD